MTSASFQHILSAPISSRLALTVDLLHDSSNHLRFSIYVIVKGKDPTTITHMNHKSHDLLTYNESEDS